MDPGAPPPTTGRGPAPSPLRRLTAVRYVLPLREGGSLPALIEADDGQLYVLKFHGAGQGPKALVAEVLAGEIARALGLAVPELCLVEVQSALGRTEPDPEIQQLVQASVGLNLGLAYLPGSVMFAAGASPRPAGTLASSVVWLDAYVSNVDRTARNSNLLLWRGGLWLIDHGSAFYWHHDWNPERDRSADPFPLVRDHLLLPWADRLTEVDLDLPARLTDGILAAVTDLVPDDWLAGQAPFPSPAQHRAAYLDYLRRRRDGSATFVKEATDARTRRL